MLHDILAAWTCENWNRKGKDMSKYKFQASKWNLKSWLRSILPQEQQRLCYGGEYLRNSRIIAVVSMFIPISKNSHLPKKLESFTSKWLRLISEFWENISSLAIHQLSSKGHHHLYQLHPAFHHQTLRKCCRNGCVHTILAPRNVFYTHSELLVHPKNLEWDFAQKIIVSALTWRIERISLTMASCNVLAYAPHLVSPHPATFTISGIGSAVRTAVWIRPGLSLKRDGSLIMAKSPARVDSTNLQRKYSFTLRV